MLGYLRAVFWFARTDPVGGGEGMAVVKAGRGEVMTEPNAAKELGVRGIAGMVIFGEGIEGAMVVSSLCCCEAGVKEDWWLTVS